MEGFIKIYVIQTHLVLIYINAIYKNVHELNIFMIIIIYTSA